MNNKYVDLGKGDIVNRVIQKGTTDCGLACIAMLSEIEDETVRSRAIELGLKKDGKFYTYTCDLVSLGSEFGLMIDPQEREFESFDSLTDKAILAINYNEGKGTWHWVVFHRTPDEKYVLDPRGKLPKRTGGYLPKKEKIKFWLKVTVSEQNVNDQ